MKIVAQNSAAELTARRKQRAKDCALESVTGAARDLAMNLFRGGRGAGSTQTIASFAAAFVTAVVAHREATSASPPAEDLAVVLQLQDTAKDQLA